MTPGIQQPDIVAACGKEVPEAIFTARRPEAAAVEGTGIRDCTVDDAIKQVALPDDAADRDTSAKRGEEEARGERLVANAGDEAYGALSLIVQRFVTARRVVRHVPPGAFMPPPTVTSSIVRLDVDPSATHDADLVTLIHQSFAHRRKTLKRNLLYAGHGPDSVDAALAALDLNPRVRAEALPLDAFERLLLVLEPTG